MKNDYMAFVSYEGNKILSFIQVKNQFFVNYGNRISISPMNRIKSIDYSLKQNFGILHFEGINNKGGTLKIIFKDSKLIAEFIKRFINLNKNKTETKYSLFSLFPKMSPAPEISIIDLTSFLKSEEVFKCNNLIELKIPEMALLKLSDEKYTQFPPKWTGMYIPVNYYIIMTKKTNLNYKKFKEVVVKSAESIHYTHFKS